MIKSFRDLDVWKKSIELVKEIYRITEEMPNTEKYGLISQMRRAVVSIPSNIAEGFRRKSPREFRQFLSIALGSLAELETQLVIAKELNYLRSENEIAILEYIDHISRMISNLIKRL